MIIAENVGVQIKQKTILNNISLSVQPRKFSVILGKNGAGKSTLLKALSGESEPSQGKVFLHKKPIASYTSQQLADQRAVLSQSVQLVYDLPVGEVVEMGCYNHYHDLSRATRKELIELVAQKLQLEPFMKRMFFTLSGGEQKRVLLAKCLLQLYTGQKFYSGNQYLLLDEPTAALDVEQQYLFMNLASELAQNEGIGVVAVLHDLNLAARFAQHVFILCQGALHTDTCPEKAFTPEILQQTFSINCLVQQHPDLNIPLITTYGKLNTATQRISHLEGQRA